MNRYRLNFNLEADIEESTLSRYHQPDCTMVWNDLPETVDVTRIGENVDIIKKWKIMNNLDYKPSKTSRSQPFRFVDGSKIVFAEVFAEALTTYNRKQMKKKRKQDVETYYDKCAERRYKTTAHYNSLAQGEAKDKAQKKIFHLTRFLRVEIGSEKTGYPTTEQIDEFARLFTKWFQNKYQQMPVFVSCVRFDERTKIKNGWIPKPPTFYLGFIPVAINPPEKKQPKVLAWNRCLEQTTKVKGYYAYTTFLKELVAGLNRSAKQAGFEFEYSPKEAEETGAED